MIPFTFTSLTIAAEAGLTMDDWDEFEDVMANGTQQEKNNYKCWMERYLSGCALCQPCRGPDPFDD